MTEHTHDFGPPQAKGTVGWCIVYECNHLNVIDHRNGKWRELTQTEQTNVTLQMWEDTILAQSMQIVHGKESGLARYRYLSGMDKREGGAL